MALADKLQELEPKKRNNYCAYQALYGSLSEIDQKALDDAWDRGYSVNTVLMAIRSEGYKSSNESIRKHRLGACKCPKTK